MRTITRLFRNRLMGALLAVVFLGLAMTAPASPAAASATPANTVVGWGDNDAGEATPPAGLTGVIAIAAGGGHSLALNSDGTVVGWGDNRYGQATPPAGLSGVTAIAAGWFHSLALRSDGTVVGWGWNGSGVATPPAGLSGVTAIAAGEGQSLALKSDGTVVGWGSGGAATPPVGLNEVTAIAAGGGHSLALKSDGTVVGWGSNNYGQATPPAWLSGVIAIAAGGYHSLALKSDGTVVGWGFNNSVWLDYSGQATPPSGLTGVTAIAAGAYYSLALKSDGTVVGWGDNTDYDEATPPAGLSRVTAIAAGGFHGLALVGPVDTTPPTATVSSPLIGASFTAGERAVASYACADEAGGSGLARCTGQVDGSPVANGAALPTSAAGSHTLMVTATDNAGNTITAARTYVVFSSFGNSSGRVQGPPSLNTTIKAGATVPVLFGLGGNHGLGIFSRAPTAARVSCITLTGAQTDTVPSTKISPASDLSLDPASARYTYRWKTSRTWAGQCWQLALPFGPNAGNYAGATALFNFQFEK